MTRSLLPRPAPARATLLAILVAALLGGTGCGKKGPPRPPLRIRPEAPRALLARQRDDAIWISLREPAARTDGSALGEDVLLRVFFLPGGAARAATAPRPGRTPRPIRTSGAPSREIGRQEWAAYRVGKRLEIPFTLESLRREGVLSGPGGAAGRIAVAAEVQEGRRKRSELAGPLPLSLCAAPPSPASLLAEMTETGVRLRWSPPEAGGMRANLYRAVGEEAMGEEPHASVAAQEGTHLDSGVTLGKLYRYELRFAAGEGNSSCESSAAEASARAVDSFPPAPPAGVAAAAETDLIRLFWSPGNEADLAGYIVYRRDGEGGELRRMNEALITDTTWADDSVQPGILYTYVVTAVDGADPPNESGRSQPVSERIR